MSDLELYQLATAWACIRRDWRHRAAQGGSAVHSRRQCLRHARNAEARIVDLAITAEKRARREAPAPALEVPA
jgi:hypothetical protein